MNSLEKKQGVPSHTEMRALLAGIFITLCSQANEESVGCRGPLGSGPHIVDLNFGEGRKVAIRIVETEKDVRSFVTIPRAFSIFSVGDKIKVTMTEILWDPYRSAHADMTLAVSQLFPGNRIQMLGKGYLRLSQFGTIELFKITRSRLPNLLAEKHADLAPDLQFVLNTFSTKIGMKLDIDYEAIMADYAGGF